MKILVDIGHPAHVHLYRNLISELRMRGVDVTITVRDIPSAKDLLAAYQLPFIEIGRKRDSFFGKMIDQIIYDLKVLKIVRHKRITLGIGSSIVLTHVSLVSGMTSIILDDDDDEVEPLFRYFAHPFADFLLSPDVLAGKRRRKDTIYYSGYHELAYLHPKRFTPDKSVLEDLGIKDGEKYFIMRFNAFKAHHDSNVSGLSLAQKLKLTERLKSEGRVFITAERDIEPELAGYQLNVPKEKIHSLIYFAAIFIGDSQTMTSEAAVLGTPSLRLNSLAGKISYLEEEEHKYGLTYAFQPCEFENMLAKLNDLLMMPDLKDKWEDKRTRMLADKIDVTSFLVWFVENYPESIKTVREEPGYNSRF